MSSSEVVINLKNLGENLRFVREFSGDMPVFAVLKSEAYGLGVEVVAKYLEKKFSTKELPIFCLARVEEVLQIRKLGVSRDCLVLSGAHSEALYDELDDSTHLCFSSIEDLQLFAKRKNTKNKVQAHLHFNTGMNRLGISIEELNDVNKVSFFKLLKICVEKGMILKGIMSHLACAERPLEFFSQTQLETFEEGVSVLKSNWNKKELGEFPEWVHLKNSEGISHEVTSKVINAVRPGLHLWGVQESLHVDRVPYELKPVVSVRARIRQIHDLKKGDSIGYGLSYACESKMKVATINIGYADGVRICSSDNGLSMIINGVRAPLLGRISMDLCSVDISKITNVKVGDWAYWICPEQSLEEIASKWNTISYEVQCALSSRLTRKIVGEEQDV